MPIFSCVCVYILYMYFLMWKHVHINAGVGKYLRLTLPHHCLHHSSPSLWYVVSQSNTEFANNARLAISLVPGISCLYLFGAGMTGDLPYTTSMSAGYTYLIFMPVQQMTYMLNLSHIPDYHYHNIFQKQT